MTRDAMAAQGLASANDEVLVSLLDAETGQRGFLLTGRDSYLVPYDEGVARLPALLARMDRFAAVLPEQRPAVARIRQLVNAKLQELDATIRLRRTAGSAAPASWPTRTAASTSWRTRARFRGAWRSRSRARGGTRRPR